MKANPEYRLQLYALLYAAPPCARIRPGQSRLRMLAAGSGDVCLETFRALFWCAQTEGVLSGVLPEITILSPEASFVRAALEDPAQYPALPELLQKGYAAPVRYVSSAEQLAGEFDYIVADSLKTARVLPELAAEGAALCVRAEKSTVRPLRRKAAAVGAELIAFGGAEEAAPDGETPSAALRRMAENISFSYALSYDQRSNEAQNRAAFAEQYRHEFVDCDTDSYGADSSFAAAAHISSKLALCRMLAAREGRPDADPLAELTEACRKHDARFSALSVLEHRRWCAFMAMRGYRRPTDEEFPEVCRSNATKDVARRLHICLCDCAPDGANPVMNRRDFWENDPPEDLSELDLVSWRYHRVAADYASHLEMTRHTLLNEPRFSDLAAAVNALLQDEPGAALAYHRELNRVKFLPEAIFNIGDFNTQLTALERDLKPVLIRNQRINFLSIDAQLVDFLPFCLWHGRRFGTVICFSGDVLAEDAVLPVLLCAERAVFVGANTADEGYRMAAERFFAGRGGNTKPEFVALDTADPAAVEQWLDGLLASGAFDPRNLVLNIVSYEDSRLGFLVGAALGKYEGLVRAHYDPHLGVVALGPDSGLLSVGPTGMSLSVREYVQLMGGEVTEHGEDHLTQAEFDRLSAMFWKYVDEPGVWSGISAFLQRDKKPDPKRKTPSPNSEFFSFALESRAQPEGAYRVFDQVFDRRVFQECAIGSLLQDLQAFRLIADLAFPAADGGIRARFDVCDDAIFDALSAFTGRSAPPEHRLRFSPKEGVRVVHTHLRKYLCTMSESEETAARRMAFFTDLHAAGIITEPVLKNGIVEFAFRSPDMAELIEKQGQLFEIILYRDFRNCGYFDDVATGVKIAWNNRTAVNQKSDFARRVRLRIDADAPDARLPVSIEAYQKAVAALGKESDGQFIENTNNELDVVAMRGVTPVFISCKTSREIKNEFIYEIDAISTHFRGFGGLAASLDVSKLLEGGSMKDKATAFRARQQEVSYFGRETLTDPALLRTALRRIADGDTWSVM